MASPLRALVAALRAAPSPTEGGARARHLAAALLSVRAASHFLSPSDARLLLRLLRDVVANPLRTHADAKSSSILNDAIGDVIGPVVLAASDPRAALPLLFDMAKSGTMWGPESRVRAAEVLFATDEWLSYATLEELAMLAVVLAPCNSALARHGGDRVYESAASMRAIDSVIARAVRLASSHAHDSAATPLVALLTTLSASRVRATHLFNAAAPIVASTLQALPNSKLCSSPELEARAWKLCNVASAYAAQAVTNPLLVDVLAQAADIVAKDTLTWLASATSLPDEPRRRLVNAVAPLLYRLCTLSALQNHVGAISRGLAAAVLLGAPSRVARREAARIIATADTSTTESSSLKCSLCNGSAPPQSSCAALRGKVMPVLELDPGDLNSLPPWIRMQLHFVHLGILAASRTALSRCAASRCAAAFLPAAAVAALYRAVDEQQPQQQSAESTSFRGVAAVGPAVVAWQEQASRRHRVYGGTRRRLSHVERLTVDALASLARERSWIAPAAEYRTVIGLDVDVALRSKRAHNTVTHTCGIDSHVALANPSLPLAEEGCIAIEVDGPWHYAFDVGPPEVLWQRSGAPQPKLETVHMQAKASNSSSAPDGSVDQLDLATLYRRWLLRSFGWTVVAVPYVDHAEHLLDRSIRHRSQYLLARLRACNVSIEALSDTGDSVS